tara:strand:- start:358 stop:543 length:186 start_codon:yes stop_codon:yes gene_type:complete
MKIKKEFIGHFIYKGKRAIHLSEVVDERTMEMLKNEYPHYLEEKKPKKAPKKKEVESDEVE